jgi:hypothetical protein
MALETRSATKMTSAVAYDLIGAASEVTSAEYVTTVASQRLGIAWEYYVMDKRETVFAVRF